MGYKVETTGYGTVINSLDKANEFVQRMQEFAVIAQEESFLVSNGWETYSFAEQSDAEAKCQALNTRTWQIVEIPDSLPIIDYVEQFKKDLEFGQELIKTFLIDNRLAPMSVSPADSIALLQKFQAVDALCAKGDIKSVAMLLPTIATDTIYTQERKDKYTQMLNGYIQK